MWWLLAKPLGKVIAVLLIAAGAQLAGFPVIELTTDTLGSFVDLGSLL